MQGDSMMVVVRSFFVCEDSDVKNLSGFYCSFCRDTAHMREAPMASVALAVSVSRRRLSSRLCRRRASAADTFCSGARIRRGPRKFGGSGVAEVIIPATWRSRVAVTYLEPNVLLNHTPGLLYYIILFHILLYFTVLVDLPDMGL